MSENTQELLYGPLHEWHVAHGAKMAEFGGWLMPLQYDGGGVVAEHTAVRTAVGLFDVSHLGKAEIRGPGAREFANRCLSNDLFRIAPGSAQYTLALTPEGTVIDDLIAYLRGDGDVFLIPNAANTAAVVAALVEARDAEGSAPETKDLEIRDLHRDFAVFAVQGPASAAVMEALGLPQPAQYMSFVDAVAVIGGAELPLTVCRTGYTGEHGYEIVPRWADAPAVWEALAAEVGRAGGKAAGLGARDTLRTEMGYALHGHELSTAISPLEAGVGWAVGWKKEGFWGRDALVAQKAAGAPRKSVGLLATERGVPRAGAAVLDGAGAVVGTTTSGTFSPTLGNGVALALVAPSVALGDTLALDIRGRRLGVTVVKPPFVQVNAKD
ncbi:aminomethyltransferase [Arthrobacter silviterrae]|uniref:Aminomethyltransferase n=1 Tax=Arthrobacter silviterrae TaxID=2026658 RepID=A0ABX0DI77_9MICC|nr:glycine cleavage system aminomethyltransferase GcvT [Arthrobacter silviterrae]MDQ0275829.1 aminomethyltransferase [Arthrobacter silviterrae]NGN85135.1 glycine cleavage system aminomethyltransferase GcvT [Arthrobacter silviterrae]